MSPRDLGRGRFACLWLAALVLTSGAYGQARGEGEGGEPEDTPGAHLSVFYDALHLIRAAYVEEPDLAELMSGALDSVTDALDPFSAYIPAAQVEGFLAARRLGSSRSGLVVLRERGFLYVAGLIPGSPGAAAGIELGDVVSEIGGRSTRMMPAWKVLQVLTDEPGTALDLEILRRGEPHEVSLVLSTFVWPEVDLEEVDGGAVLRVPRFDSGTVAAVRRALGQASRQGHEGLLLDLRGGVGGEPEVAYAVADLFTQGKLGSLRNRAATLRQFEADEAVQWAGKVVVLVDESTLGPAEVLATILRQKVGAELVGRRTFGYAGHQELVELGGGDRLLLTDAFYTGPDENLLRQRLEPDHQVRRSFTVEEAAPSDQILEQGLERLRGGENDESEAKQKAA